MGGQRVSRGDCGEVCHDESRIALGLAVLTRHRLYKLMTPRRHVICYFCSSIESPRPTDTLDKMRRVRRSSLECSAHVVHDRALHQPMHPVHPAPNPASKPRPTPTRLHQDCRTTLSSGPARNLTALRPAMNSVRETHLLPLPMSANV